MSTKTTVSVTQSPGQSAAPGAAPASANPSQGTEAQFAAFLAAFASTGYHKRAAEAAGLSLEAVAARIDSDEAFASRYRIARKTRRMLVEDAVLNEALGVEHTDPVNGKVTLARDLKTLHRLAVKEEILDPENKAPAVAIQNNVTAVDPRLVAAQDELRRRLTQFGAPKAIEAIDAVIVEQDNHDLLE